jgi:glycosyltransferase involved in cell wall biosynthesis
VSERTESGRPEISIIVPVYQVEKYLNECIDSILAQTFTDFELILVDDGSPDNCPALCDAAAKRDSRVRVIHKQNGGVSTARNAGLDAAQGNWIAFVDSDDTVEPEYLEKMHKAALETGADFAICSRRKFCAGWWCRIFRFRGISFIAENCWKICAIQKTRRLKIPVSCRSFTQERLLPAVYGIFYTITASLPAVPCTARLP